MSALRHLCLSDLHLGAAYSILTHVGDNGDLEAKVPGHSLTALAAALRPTVKRLSDGQPPTLVLMGDVIDMGLSDAGDVSRAFLRFIEAMFPANEPPVFSNQVICIPGNHDHHLWRMAQDDQYVGRLEKGAEDDIGHDIPKVTPLLGQPTVPCRSLTALMRMQPHLADARVDIAYPNFGLVNAAGDRGVVMHHGHYIDSMYRVMSRLNGWLDGGGRARTDVAALEAQNGSWVDFLWSDLGSSGAMGKDALTLYETMLDAGAAHSFAERMADLVMAKVGAGFSLHGDTALAYGLTVSELVRGLIDLGAGAISESQRDGYRSVLNATEIQDLHWYLGGPVAAQLKQEGAALPERLSFIFGHTHKPFQDQLSIAEYRLPVALYNTGGWVMDQPTMMACQGGAAVLVDDDLNVASLRLFNDPINGVMAPVSAAGLGGFLDAENPLLAAAKQAISETGTAWAEFSARALFGTQQRAELHLMQNFRPAAAE